MIVSYCKKCKKESEGSVCRYCGKRASASCVRDVWRATRVPAADGAAWKSIIGVLLIVTVLILVVLFTFEKLVNSTPAFKALLTGQMLTLTLSIPFVGLLICFAALTLQGREEVRYSLDTVGVHTQVWHRASRLRSIARLQASRLNKAIAANDGTKYILADERHLIWSDINEIHYAPSAGLIKLYHTPHFAPLILRIPPEEYETAEEIVKKMAKIKD